MLGLIWVQTVCKDSVGPDLDPNCLLRITRVQIYRNVRMPRLVFSLPFFSFPNDVINWSTGTLSQENQSSCFQTE